MKNMVLKKEYQNYSELLEVEIAEKDREWGLPRIMAET